MVLWAHFLVFPRPVSMVLSWNIGYMRQFAFVVPYPPAIRNDEIESC